MAPFLTALAWIAVPISSFLYGLALFSPLFTISPGAGGYEGVLRVVAPSLLSPQTYSLIGSIQALWETGDALLAVFLFLFSVLFPVLKFIVLFGDLICRNFVSPSFMRLLRGVVRYAMIEVFLVAILVFSVKGLPGGSDVNLHAGVWLFGLSVLLPLVCEKPRMNRPVSD